jgi:hypothetical protein
LLRCRSVRSACTSWTPRSRIVGFETCGSHIDDEDGLEIEYVRRFDAWPVDWRVKSHLDA